MQGSTCLGNYPTVSCSSLSGVHTSVLFGSGGLHVKIDELNGWHFWSKF